MKLTKDEASILAEAMDNYKYQVINDYKDFKDEDSKFVHQGPDIK